MATLYKCTAYFSCNNQGWSEVYVMDAELALPPPGQNPTNNYTNLEAVENVFMGLMNKRMPLAGAQVGLYATRINRLLNPRQARLSYWKYPGNAGQDADDDSTSLVVTCQNLTNDQQKQIHMRGNWDTINVQGGQFDPAPPGWTTLWNAYVGQMVNGPYGWYGKLQSFVSNVSDYVQTVDGFVTIDVATQNFFVAPPGTKLQVRLAGVNNQSELNGQLLVQVVNPTRVQSVKRISVFPYVGGGTLRYNTKQFIKITTVRPQKIGTRKAGAPLFQLRGRARARVRS